MTDYVKKALFIFDDSSKYLCESLEKNPFEVEMFCVEIGKFESQLQSGSEVIEHVVAAGSLSLIKRVFALAKTHHFGVGLLALPKQSALISCFDLSPTLDAGIDLALQADVGQWLDLVFCNDKMLLFKATMGRIPLLDSAGDSNRFHLLQKAVKQLIKIKLLPFKITTKSGEIVNSCACGCMVVQHHRGTLASRLLGDNCSSINGKVSLLISAPFSIYTYLQFILSSLVSLPRDRDFPSTVGYIESPQITIDSTLELDVSIDGEKLTITPVLCRVEERVVRVNIGTQSQEKAEDQEAVKKEKIEISNLPKGKEVNKLQQKHLPFFSIAAEDRFKDLFIALRDDARISASYITLMLLSTLLATIGVYLNSSAVVIGAMLLAPLMAPIVSLSMGLLRRNNELTVNSLKKISLGIVLALVSSALLVLIFSYKPITSEMLGRLNPSLLDLGVAIIAGIAAAYTKSYKEIMQGLAGVAIAVALVPPLAVAGIGLGRGDVHFFSQAFLLFLTNLVGIVLAALLTFRVLGFSPAVKARRSVFIVLLMMVLITVPLYFSYNKILNRYHAEKNWQLERFLVDGKYIIIRNIRFNKQKNRHILFMDILARESLSRKDLNLLKQKIQTNFPGNLVIRARIEYIL